MRSPREEAILLPVSILGRSGPPAFRQKRSRFRTLPRLTVPACPIGPLRVQSPGLTPIVLSPWGWNEARHSRAASVFVRRRTSVPGAIDTIRCSRESTRGSAAEGLLGALGQRLDPRLFATGGTARGQSLPPGEGDRPPGAGVAGAAGRVVVLLDPAKDVPGYPAVQAAVSAAHQVDVPDHWGNLPQGAQGDGLPLERPMDPDCVGPDEVHPRALAASSPRKVLPLGLDDRTLSTGRKRRDLAATAAVPLLTARARACPEVSARAGRSRARGGDSARVLGCGLAGAAR